MKIYNVDKLSKATCKLLKKYDIEITPELIAYLNALLLEKVADFADERYLLASVIKYKSIAAGARAASVVSEIGE